MTEKRNVLVLGYGEMGHAMEVLLAGRVVLAMVKQHQLFDMNQFPLFMLASKLVNEPVDVRQTLVDWLQQENRQVV